MAQLLTSSTSEVVWVDPPCLAPGAPTALQLGLPAAAAACAPRPQPVRLLLESRGVVLLDTTLALAQGQAVLRWVTDALATTFQQVMHTTQERRHGAKPAPVTLTHGVTPHTFCPQKTDGGHK